MRNLNPLLGRYRLPREILKRIDYILEEKTLGEQGAVLVLLDPVRDDVRELEDAVNMYPLEVELTNDLVQMDIKDTSNQLVKGQE